MSAPKVSAEFCPAWRDDVGGSIGRRVSDTVQKLNKAAEEFEKARQGAENSIKNMPHYASHSAEIRSLKVG